MQKAKLVLSALLMVLLLVACAPKAIPASAPTAAPQVPAASAAMPAPAAPLPVAPARPAWEEKWEKTMAAAKQEGRLVLYTTIGAQARIVVDGFTSKYGVRTEAVMGPTAQLITKIVAERRAGIYSADVWLAGASTWASFPPDVFDSLDSKLMLQTSPRLKLSKRPGTSGSFLGQTNPSQCSLLLWT